MITKLELSMSYFIHSTKRKGGHIPDYINEFYPFYKDTSQVFFSLQRDLGIIKEALFSVKIYGNHLIN